MGLGERFDEILAAAKTGAPWAIEALYLDLHPAILAFVRTRAPSEAEDLASDVFLAAAQGLVRFEGDEAAFRSWLFTIAYRKVGELRRRWARRRTDPAPAETIADHLAPGDVETEAIEAIGTDEALAMISRLPEAQAEVVLLRVLADLSVEDVAQIVGKRPGAVRALQHRALLRLARESGDA